MKYLKYRSITIYIIFLLALIFENPAFSESTQKKTLIDDASRPIVIKSDSLEIDNKRYAVTFSGNVEAVIDDMNINCQEIDLFYEDLSGSNDPEITQARILEIVAKKNVRISRPDGGMATAEQAVYYQKDEKVVLTGKPVVKQGTDSVEGSKITLFLKEERIVVEGSKEGKAKAVLLPKEER